MLGSIARLMMDVKIQFFAHKMQYLLGIHFNIFILYICTVSKKYVIINGA
jgi:hypothetical protein